MCGSSDQTGVTSSLSNRSQSGLHLVAYYTTDVREQIPANNKLPVESVRRFGWVKR